MTHRWACCQGISSCPLREAIFFGIVDHPPAQRSETDASHTATECRHDPPWWELLVSVVVQWPLLFCTNNISSRWWCR